MLDKFQKYYSEHQLFNQTDKILLAVSGGKDSVAMVDLFSKSQLNIGILHCNFKLRNNDSDLDEQLVEEIAQSYQVPFFKKNFDTKNYAEDKGISIQMAARELRYDWFEQIRESEGYDYVATAHHKNDVVETMLINLTKGTGIAGLHGILNKKEKVIRPLLCYTSQEITDFVKEQHLSYREDSSNTEVKYTRNKIRHQIIPKLEEINPSLIETLYDESQQFLELEQILIQKIDSEKKKYLKEEGDLIKIDIQKLLKLTPLRSYLYYFLKDSGFNIADVKNIIDGLDNHSGKTYYSSTHQLVKDRNELILRKKGKPSTTEFLINSTKDLEKLPFCLNLEVVDELSDLKINKSSNYAYLDANEVTFPLTIRKWEKGDAFRPLGMKGFKKVSDLFIDNKFSLVDKEDCWLLLSSKKIIWLIGHRIDDRFKVTDKTKKLFVFSTS